MPGKRLGFEEREEIAWRRGPQVRSTGDRPGDQLGPGTVSRELQRNISPSPRRYQPELVPCRATASAGCHTGHFLNSSIRNRKFDNGSVF